MCIRVGLELTELPGTRRARRARETPVAGHGGSQAVFDEGPELPLWALLKLLLPLQDTLKFLCEGASL